MAKIKPARGKAKNAPAMRNGAPCLVLLVSALLLAMFLLYYVMKHASG